MKLLKVVCEANMKTVKDSIRLIFCLILFPCLFVGCKKSNTSTLTLSLSPKTVTALNVVAWTCADKEKYASDSTHGPTGSAASASFRSMVITWSNTNADLLVYAMRITGKNTSGAAIDVTLSGQDFWASVFGGGLDTTKNCYFCAIPKTTKENPTWTQTVTAGVTFTNYLGTATAGTGCGPMVTGISVPTTQVGDVLLNLKATILAYSTDSDGNVNNEYATFPFTVRLQAPPL